MKPAVVSPIKLIDFLLIGHSEPPIRLDALLRSKVLVNHPPQSITELPEERYLALKHQIIFGFEI
jgi:hypothetical protein